jgi:hypothetical protein
MTSTSRILTIKRNCQCFLNSFLQLSINSITIWRNGNCSDNSLNSSLWVSSIKPFKLLIRRMIILFSILIILLFNFNLFTLIILSCHSLLGITLLFRMLLIVWSLLNIMFLIMIKWRLSILSLPMPLKSMITPNL